jgi:hypothetical protein
MKLNPPASSSDLETARQIARRLHQSRRRDDRAATTWPSEEAPARPRLTPPPLPSRPAPAELPEPPARAERVERVARPVPAAPLPPPPEPEPEPALPDVSVDTDSADPSFDLPEAPPFDRPSWSEPPAPEPEPAPLEDLAGAVEPEPAMPDVDLDLDEPPLSPEEMVGESVESEASPLDQLTEPEASPFGDELLDAPPDAEEPAPPSWDNIVETCKGLAQANGAMLVDPAGQVFAARGDWPAPGPDAIAGKLVAMMAKTLKDAPTRSISAPLMGMHLTAWRVPLSEGLVTAAFIGAAPVRAEARPAIDAEILSGVGS